VGSNARWSVGRLLTTVTLLGVASTPGVEAQVGLSSHTAQIALVARVPLRASMPGMSSLLQTSRKDRVSEGSVMVRFTANTTYRLLVRGTDLHSSSRVWVRSGPGDYTEVKAGQSVTLVHGEATGGPSEREVSYRIESDEEGVPGLPLRYEVVIEPSI
jgi:hypothetical protein